MISAAHCSHVLQTNWVRRKIFRPKPNLRTNKNLVTWSIGILARSILRGGASKQKEKHVNICNGLGFFKLLMQEKGIKQNGKKLAV